MPLKISIDARSVADNRTGVGNYVVNLISSLKKLDDKNIYFIFKSSFRHGVKKIPFFSRMFRAFFFLYDNFIFPFKLLLINTDVYHSPAFILPLINFKYKKIITIADLGFYVYGRGFSRKWHEKHLKFMLPRSVRKADRIIAISESTRKQIIEIFDVPPEKVVTVHLGVSEKYKIMEDRASVDRFIEKYGIKKPFILFVGNMDPRKNLKRLISAFRSVKKEVKTLQLVIVGNKGELFQKDIMEEVKRGDVILPGYISEEEIICAYNAAAVFVFPSLYEGFGLPILEAMACGAPVVASNVYSMPEVAGGAAVTVNPESTEEITAAILKILNDENFRKNLIAGGLNRAKKFGWETTAQKTLEIYKSV